MRIKFFNFRLPAALALSLIAGIVYGTALAYFNLDGIYILIPFAVAAVAFIACIVIYKRVSLAVCFALVVAFFLIGSLCTYLNFTSFGVSEVPAGQTYTVTGRVDKIGVTSYGKTYLVISGACADGIRINGKVIAYLGVNAGEYCEAGYTVSFSAPLLKESFFSGGEIGYRAQNGIKYYCTVTEGLQSKWNFSLFGSVNGAIRNALFDNLDYETAAVCFAMLTGDSSLVYEGTLASFRGGGIAHLFAVSGLHIGVIFGAFTLLFKKLPVNRYISAVVRIGVVLFYSGVCSFTPSSVRAAVTCTVAVVASLSYKKYDALNALSLACVLLLFINPLYLYGAGFLLSFGAALGILMLSQNIGKIFRFLPEKPRKTLAVATSAHISTLPAQLVSFGYVSWAGLILNMIILPVVSAVLLLLYICAMLSAVVPVFAGALIPFSAAPVQLLINLVTECGLENAVITQSAGLWIYIPFALLFIGISDKFNLRRFPRGVFCSAAVLCLAAGLIF